MILPAIASSGYWSLVVNFIIQNYFLEWTTICIVKSEQILFDLEITNSSGKLNQFIIINLKDLKDSINENTYDFPGKIKFFDENNLYHNDLLLKLAVSIESSYCEAFVVFQDSIPEFARIYYNASLYSDWRSTRNHFVFAFSRDLMKGENYLDQWFFKDQSRYVTVESECSNCSIFDLRTNRFVGQLKAEQEEFYLLNRIDAKYPLLEQSQVELFPNKMKDLQGREVILGAFDYRPFVAVDFERKPNLIDHAESNPTGKIYVDGAEVRVLFTFCEVYNCTVGADTSDNDWGFVYTNLTGYGFRLILVNRRVDMTLGANYYWLQPYVDRSHYIGFSAITMLVPRPQADITWNLPLKPFQLDLWLGICAYLVIESISLVVTREMERLFKENFKHEWNNSIKYGYVTALKLFISQSSGYEVTSVSLRTLLFACYMNDIIVTSIYGGGLASILTLPILAEAPDTMERFVKFGLTWTGTSPVWTEPFDAAAKGTVEHKFVSSYRVYPLEELIKMAKDGNYGFVIERMMNGHFGNTDFVTPEALDHLKVLVEDLSTQYTICFVPRGWAMEEQLNEFIMNWHTGGFGLFWEWKASSDLMNQNEQGRIALSKHLGIETGPEKLDMTHFAGVMLILVVGLLLSIIFFGFEMLQTKYDLKTRLKEKLKPNFNKKK